MKKKVTISILLIIVILSSTYFLLSLKDKKDVEAALDGFYTDFIDRKYEDLYKHFAFKFSDYELVDIQGTIAQSLINDRNFYGDVKRIRYKYIFWTGPNKRFVFVEVQRHDGGNTSTDKIKLQKMNNEWVIDSYINGDPIKLP
ncbi:hypothetical protein A7K91_00555 [Paenibacillus oryzae]|uniref:DUF4878 domain-containing protein n=1 Tax=Paenibacillus oryzae TaxID=1844972 RepID=A0A1A5YHY4_9BACL|nr:hypothetical protein [Paenibacillus oryzae]OBR65202.1 hypothetical protein A7K91_00555 [Paenibacillus oryzae]